MDLTSELLKATQAHLFRELDDAETARQLAHLLHEDALSWRVTGTEINAIRTILAFTFGNRMQANGNRTPGPVNQAIARVAVALAQATGAIVYAQWEIAEAMGNAVPSDRVVAIYPEKDGHAEPVYLSTSGTIRRVVEMVPDPASLGVVGIVGFRDHLRRCVTTARALGLDAHAPAGYAMPTAYDPHSGQPWCRSRLAYLMHDIAIRATERRDLLAATSEVVA